MLSRYQIVRGRPASELPKGTRIDVRKHIKHVLSPEPEAVTAFLESGTDAAFATFARRYRSLLKQRFGAQRERFDALAQAAREGDVYLGCNCPTAKNPDVQRCHTTLALQFMQENYPDLEIRYSS